LTPLEYIKEINKNFWPAKRGKLSRLDVVWGKFSVSMNTRLRKETSQARKDGDELLTQKLIDVFSFWQIRSQTLDLNQRAILNKGKIKAKNKDAQKLFKFIRDGKTLNDRKNITAR